LFIFLIKVLVILKNNTSNVNAIESRYLTNEKRLINDLLLNYKVKFGRPVNNMSEKIVVYFGINLIQLIDLDERNQVLISNVHSVYVKIEELNFNFK
jgi:hypothetical protein